MKGNPADDGDPPHSATANTTATAEVASADVSIDSDPVVADAVVNLAAAGSFAVIQVCSSRRSLVDMAVLLLIHSP